MGLLVVTGPPGAGKSAVARTLADRTDRGVLVAGDAFFGFLASGRVDPWLPGSHDQNTIVTEAAGSAAGRFASGGYNTIYEGVIGPWFLPTFLGATGLDHLDYVVLLPSLEVCVERVATRPGHGFTDEPATRKMHAEFARAEVAERHVLRDPPGTVAEAADAVATLLAQGRLAFGPL